MSAYDCGRATITVVDRRRLTDSRRRRRVGDEFAPSESIYAQERKVKKVEAANAEEANETTTTTTRRSRRARRRRTRRDEEEGESSRIRRSSGGGGKVIVTMSRNSNKKKPNGARRIPLWLVCSGCILATVMLIDTIGSQLTRSSFASSRSLITGALASTDLGSAGAQQTAIQSKYCSAG